MKQVQFILLSALGISLLACIKLVELSPPQNVITDSDAFGSDLDATRYLANTYESMAFTYSKYLSVQSAAYVDDLIMLNHQQTWSAFARSSVDVDNRFNQNIWNGLYEVIYKANVGLEQITKGSVSESFKRQFTGELLFLRAYSYFWLIQLYGSVPLISSPDPVEAANTSRTSLPQIIDFIRNNLSIATSLLKWETHIPSKFQINKAAVLALRARVELQENNWIAVILNADSIIHSGLYELTSIDKVFAERSLETIWQLQSANGITMDAQVYISPNLHKSPNFIMSNSFNAEADPADLRFRSWLSCSNQQEETCYPFKYKNHIANNPEKNEHMVQFRLAEIILMSAEAYWRLGQHEKSGFLVNSIRIRAGLPEKNQRMLNSNLQQHFLAERRIELFTESGLRLYDLRRFHLIDEVLSKSKPNWQTRAVFLPIPAAEIKLNSTLDQNPGY